MAVWVDKTCEFCGVGYQCERHRAGKSRFCSLKCQNDWQRRNRQTRKTTCAQCQTEFLAVKDHGKWQKFCGRACFTAKHMPPKDKPCDSCGGMFTAIFTNRGTPDGYRRYCSDKCRHDGLRTAQMATCLHCQGEYQIHLSILRRRRQAGCCSAACRVAHYRGPHSKGFKSGAYTHTQSGERHVLLERPGYTGKYVGEHRVVASQAIGRMVTRGEYVIRINRNPLDNRPENLFICASNSEFSRRRSGSLPWPNKSNLGSYLTASA